MASNRESKLLLICLATLITLGLVIGLSVNVGLILARQNPCQSVQEK